MQTVFVKSIFVQDKNFGFSEKKTFHLLGNMWGKSGGIVLMFVLIKGNGLAGTQRTSTNMIFFLFLLFLSFFRFAFNFSFRLVIFNE